MSKSLTTFLLSPIYVFTSIDLLCNIQYYIRHDIHGENNYPKFIKNKNKSIKSKFADITGGEEKNMETLE